MTSDSVRTGQTMGDDDEREALRLFDQVLELPVDQREPWLQAQTGTWSPATLTRLRRLLARESVLGGFLERPAAGLALDMPNLPAVGDHVGHYQLLRLIEAGGMGVVYLARRADRAYEQDVAIKFVQPLHLTGDPVSRQRLIARFEEERAILAQLRHPNIARILDGGSTGSGIPYLVMDYVDGLALTAYCDRHGLDVEQRLRLFCKVCDGVQDAHRHLIVHRDLKPGNILVPDDGEPRLLDFGIAKLLDPARSADAEAGAEPTALTAMTPAYASPEQVRQQAITTRSDVYSLGVMLYELLAGVRPYDLSGVRPAEAERLVCEHDPEPLAQALPRADLTPAQRQQRRSAITGDLEKIVAKAMHKQAGRRYGSAQELADDLRRFLAGRPVHAHADSRRYRLGKFLRRHRLASVASTLALAAVLVAAGIAVEQARQARQAAADAGEINQFLLDVLARSDPGNTGEEITLGQALDAAAEQVDVRFGDRPGMAADIRYAIGYSMLSRYRLAAAEVQLLRGHAEAVSARGANDPRTLEILEAIALLRQYQGRTSEAIGLFESVLSGLRAGRQTQSTQYVVALNDLGVLYLGLSDYERAREYIQQAVDGIERQGVVVTVNEHANIVSNLAQALHGLEDLEAADDLYAQAADLLAPVFPDGSRDFAILLNNRALLARDQGDDGRALDLLRESVAMRKRVFRGDHPLIVFGLSNLARQEMTMADDDGALAAATEAVAMADRMFAHATEEQVVALAVRAQARFRTGQTGAAIDDLRRAESVLSQLPEPAARVHQFVVGVRDELCAGGPTQPGC